MIHRWLLQCVFATPFGSIKQPPEETTPDTCSETLLISLLLKFLSDVQSVVSGINIIWLISWLASISFVYARCDKVFSLSWLFDCRKRATRAASSAGWRITLSA